MVSLKISNIHIPLSPRQAINFIINAKFWELDFLKGSRSFSFKIPVTPPAQQVFNQPEDVPNANKSQFKTYESTAGFAGQDLYRGSFQLREANELYYDGFFKFEAADIVEFGEKSIRELLANEVHAFATTELTHLSDYLALDSNIVFPTIKYGNDIFNRYGGTGFYTETDLNDGTFVAFLKLHHVFSLIFEKINYKIENPDWHTLYPDVSKLTIWNNRELEMKVTIEYNYDVFEGVEAGETGNVGSMSEIKTIALPAKIKKADLVPDISVRDFLNTVRRLLGLHFSFNNTFKTVKISFLKDIFNQNTYKDWTDKAQPRPNNKGNTYDGIEFNFKKDGNDAYQKAMREPDSSLQKLSAKNDLGPLHFFAGETANTYRFYSQENKYYKVTAPAGETFLGILRDYLADYLPYREGNAKQKITIDCSPVPKSRFLQFRLGEPYANARKRAGDPGIRLNHWNRLVGKEGYIYVVKAKNQPEKQYLGFENDNISSIDLTVPWVKDEDGVQIIRYWRTDYILECDSPMTRTLLSQENPNFAFRLFFYHGLQQRKDENTSYPYGSPDNLSPRGNSIGEFALRFEQGGILDFFYREYLNFIQYSNTYEFIIHLTFNDLLNFKATDIIRIRESNFVVEDIDINLSSKIEPAKVKLRKLVTNAYAVETKTRTITTIYQTDCELNRTITTKYVIDCVQDAITYDVYEGFLRFNTLTPSTVRITRTFGGSMTNIFNTIASGTPLIIKFIDAPNSNLEITINAAYRGLNLATNEFDIDYVLTPQQAQYAQMSFKATIVNVAQNFYKKFNG